MKACIAWLLPALFVCVLPSSALAAGDGPRKLKVVVLEGSPRERGVAHGKALKTEIAQVLKLWKADLASTYKMDADRFIALFMKKTNFQPAMNKWTPDLIEEIEGIAQGSGVDFATLFVFQMLDEVWANGDEVVGNKCSSIGFARKGTQPTLVAQTMDLPPFYDGFQVVLHIKDRDSDLEAFVPSIPGLIGLNGVNNKSIGICCNTLLQLNHRTDGLPVACVVRGVLAQRTESDALALVHKATHASGQNYIVGGPDRVAALECGANKVASFVPAGLTGVVWHTNHPLANDDYDAKYRDLLQKNAALKQEENSRTRLACLENRLGRSAGTPSVELIKSTLSARDSESFPVSREKGKQYAFTYAAMIMVLSAQPELHIAPGPPHVMGYETLRFK
jgi:isopenicillin-N N-acyltransferase-like protein